MKIDLVFPCIEIRKMCRELNAPIYVNRHGRSGKFYLARRPSCTVEDVERFFTSVTKGERTTNEQ